MSALSNFALLFFLKGNIMIFSVPQANPAGIAYEGQCIIVYSAGDYFGNGKPFATTANSPSWSQLCDIAAEAQKVTGDKHHNFFEGVDVICETHGVPVFRLILGS